MDEIEEDDNIPKYKVLVIGDAGVGKSALIFRFADDIFRDSYISTIGIDFRIQTVNVDGRTIKLQVWDTAGQERFRTITASYYRGAHGIMIVYAIDNEATFRNVRTWLTEISKYASNDIVKIVVGSKSDAPRAVATEAGLREAEAAGATFIETSSKTGENVKLLFETMGKKVIEAYGDQVLNNTANPYEPTPEIKTLNDNDQAPKKRRFCVI